MFCQFGACGPNCSNISYHMSQARGVAMNELAQVFEYCFPTEGLAVARIGIGFDDLISRLGLALETWDEPGLGTARGATIRLPSGRIIALQELEHLRKSINVLGSDIIADAGDVLAVGGEPLINEAITAFGLSKNMLAWSAGEDLRQIAANIVEFLTARATARRPEPG